MAADLEEVVPGSMEGEGGFQQDSGIIGKEASAKVETNGDLAHDGELNNGLWEADEFGAGRADELFPGSVGPSRASAEMNGDAIEATEVRAVQDSVPAESPPAGVVSDTTGASTPTTTNKGFGLRKWRRIRRDLAKDGGTIADANRILKRGLSITEPPKAKTDIKLKSQYDGESSAASVDSRNMGSTSSSKATIRVLEPEIDLLSAVGGFSVGIDFETSDDRSSRFSTAASTPKSKHEGLGYGKDRNRVRNLGGKSSGHAVQPRGQRGKGAAVDITKKLREDQIAFEKENSHSSVESDLRSSASVFVQCGSTTSNGRKSERSLNYDGENREEAQVSVEVQAGFYKETGADIEDTSRDDHADGLGKEKIDEGENYPPDQGGDPFIESIALLQAAQEALEKEIQKFGEMGKEPTSPSGYSSAQLNYEEAEGSSSFPVELKVIKLSQKVEHLEQKLKEATLASEAKETRASELEAILNGTKLPDLPLELFKEMELELENLFRKKIEAEIESLVLVGMMQKKQVTFSEPPVLVEEFLAEGYEEVKARLNAAENKSTLLKRQLEELDVSCKDLLGTEEVLKLHNRVCQFSLCCFIQIMLLVVAFAVFLMQLLPPSGDIVPT